MIRVWYQSGTVSLTNGNINVHGDGTSFLSNVRPGDMFAVGEPVGTFYQITEVLTNTQLRILPAYVGATESGVQYSIIRNFTGAWSVPADLSKQIQELLQTFRTALENNMKGDQGEPGADGNMILSGNGAPPVGLGNINDWYIDIETFDFYRNEGITWMLRGNLRGQRGIAGADGARWFFELAPLPSTGNVGDCNLNVITGDVHRRIATGWERVGNLRGDQGERGEQGIQGERGEQGIPARWHTGLVAPLVTTGNDGDMHLNTANSTISKKINGIWMTQVNIRGLPGQQGEKGERGEQGKQGIQGEKGAPGTPTENLTAPTTGVQALGNVTGARNIDCALGDTVTLTVTGNITFTLTANAPGNQARVLMMILTNGGSRTITWPASVNWGGAAPTLNATGINVLTFVTVNNGGQWVGMVGR